MNQMSRNPQEETACKRTQEQIRKVCNDLAEFLIAKNNSYGDSALSPKRIFSKLSAAESIKLRIDDKLSRTMTGSTTFNEDTEWDLTGYLILLRCAREREAELLIAKNNSYSEEETDRNNKTALQQVLDAKPEAKRYAQELLPLRSSAAAIQTTANHSD